jgi:hypothetical protein
MSPKTRILYSGFYDAPLAFTTRHKGVCFLFWREFDETLDEYEDVYRVFVLPQITDREIKKSWQSLRSRATSALGQVGLNELRFDATKRREVDTRILDVLIERIH